MAEKKIATLAQLKKVAQRSKADSAARISELTTLVAQAVEEGLHVGITVTLPAANWSGRAQTVHDESLIADGKYRYFVGGDADNLVEYNDAGVRANNVTTTGEITFQCEITPETDLVANIVRLEVETDDEQQ